MALQRLQLKVNGKPVERETETRQNLADFLRHDLSLTGTHVGCEHGVCGSCTVLYNGEPVRSCLMLAVQADRAEITTVEGLVGNGALNSLQQDFKRHHALQCGFCTPICPCVLGTVLRSPIHIECPAGQVQGCSRTPRPLPLRAPPIQRWPLGGFKRTSIVSPASNVKSCVRAIGAVLRVK